MISPIFTLAFLAQVEEASRILEKLKFKLK